LAIFFNKYCAQPLLGSENLRPIMERFSNSCKTDLSKEKRGHYAKSVEKTIGLLIKKKLHLSIRRRQMIQKHKRQTNPCSHQPSHVKRDALRQRHVIAIVDGAS